MLAKCLIIFVAPRVGAWIETIGSGLGIGNCQVAPRVGAWIETVYDHNAVYLGEVAPRVGAWIETSYGSDTKSLLQSRPAWARGLKHWQQSADPQTLCRAPRGRVD